MNRRSFLASTVAVGGVLMLNRSAFSQSLAPATQVSSPSGQAEAIRAAAEQFLRTLAPERQGRITYAFPKGESPAAAKFTRTGGRGGGGPGGHGGPWGGPGDGPGTRPAGGPGQEFHHRPDDGGGPRGGPGKGGPGGGPAGGFIGEKYGQAVWSNFPVSDVPRPGIRMGELTAAERDAAHGLLRVVLSPMGYQKVLDIMAADQIVADSGEPYAAGLNAYTLALFGQPGATAPWMLQFGGHHLGLNVIFVGDKAVCAPLHTGILPAKFDANGKIVRGLGRENDKAFALLATFTPRQLNSAVIDHEVSDLLCGPGRPTATFAPEGLRGADMTDAQRNMMFELAREWVGVLNDVHSAQRLDAIRQSLPDTRFAWSGPTQHEPGENGESYFRIHGPSLLIEHAPQDNQGGYKLHVHTVMRDLANDYARQLTA